MLFRFGKSDSLLCFFCKMIDKAPLHLFYNCTKAKLLWDQLKEFITNETLSFSSYTPQSAILGHTDFSDDYLLINYLMLIYNLHIYISRNRGYCNIEHLKAIIDKTKNIEEGISKHELKKRSKYLMKWRPSIDDLV